MTTTVSTAPKWHATITNASVQNSGTPMSIEGPELNQLTDIINGDFVNSAAFKQLLAPFNTTLDLRVTIENGTLTIINKADSTKLLDPTKASSEQTTAFQATIAKVNELTTRIVSRPSSPVPQDISEEQNKQICEKYKVHPIDNGNNGCYAATAYQLLSNVESLKEKILNKVDHDGTNPPSKNLNDYENIHSATELLQIINTDKANECAEQFTEGKCYNPKDVLKYYVDQQNDDFGTRCALTETINDPTHLHPIYTKGTGVERTAFFELLPPNTTSPNINFIEALKHSFSLPQHQSTGAGATITERNIRFETSPKHLFVTIARDITNKTKPIDHPEMINLKDCNGLKDGVVAKPLYLKGFTIHTGSSNSGHYTAYFQKPNPNNPNESQWFMADSLPSTVKAITEESALEAAKQASDLYYDDKKPTIAKILPRSVPVSEPSSPRPLATVPSRSSSPLIDPSIAKITECLDGSKKDDINFLKEIYNSDLLTTGEKNSIAEDIGMQLNQKSSFLERVRNLAITSEFYIGQEWIAKLSAITPDANIFVKAFKDALKKKKAMLEAASAS